jgi:tRNA(Met) C34 N-acetyltransferase TmcA
MRGDGEVLSPFDLKRLQSYASNVCDHHMIQDLVPAIARAYFSQRIPVNLSYGQAAILLCVGLQHGDISRCVNATTRHQSEGRPGGSRVLWVGEQWAQLKMTRLGDACEQSSRAESTEKTLRR